MKKYRETLKKPLITGGCLIQVKLISNWLIVNQQCCVISNTAAAVYSENLYLLTPNDDCQRVKLQTNGSCIRQGAPF